MRIQTTRLGRFTIVVVSCASVLTAGIVAAGNAGAGDVTNSLIVTPTVQPPISYEIPPCSEVVEFPEYVPPAPDETLDRLPLIGQCQDTTTESLADPIEGEYRVFGWVDVYVSLTTPFNPPWDINRISVAAVMTFDAPYASVCVADQARSR